MKITRDQLLGVLADNSGPDAVLVMNEDRTTSIVVPTEPQLAALRSWSSWPMYLVRCDLAANYIREHGLDGAVNMLNLTFALIPEPDSTIVRAAAITGRFLKRRKKQPAQEEST
ncbi:hypothetical protein [Rhodococcoides fascians]|uniref:hypothetical protein n=1 Tax=Rhodococcoides fascians TaxID=1828 RepID=UPI000522E41D|nr:hypothetical protein [Rhodococcus fascians]